MNQALLDCGFNNHTRQYLMNEQGIDSAENLVLLPADELRSNCNSWARSANLPDQVAFPAVAVTKFVALAYFMSYQQSRGQQFALDHFDGNVITNWAQRVNILKQAAETDKTDVLKSPVPFRDGMVWRVWKELLSTYLAGHRSPKTGVPLTYLTRDHVEVTEEMLVVEYADIDEDLIATTELEGPQFRTDNARLWRLIKPLFCADTTTAGARSSPVWSHIQRFNASQDGRAAYLAACSAMEGVDAITNEKRRAYIAIDQARYNGRSSRFTIEHYNSTHRDALETLNFHGEEVPQTKAVTDYLNGIEDPTLSAAKDNARLHDDYKNSFEKCSQYIRSIAELHRQDQARARKVGGVRLQGRGQGRGGGRGGRGGGRGGGGRGGRGAKERIRAGHYEPSEWNALSAEEQTQVRQLREEKKRKAAAAATQPDPKKARTIKSVSTDEAPEEPTPVAAAKPAIAATFDSGTGEVDPSSAAAQFGCGRFAKPVPKAKPAAKPLTIEEKKERLANAEARIAAMKADINKLERNEVNTALAEINEQQAEASTT